MTVLTRRDTRVLWYLLSSNSGLLTARRRRDINLSLWRCLGRFGGNFCLLRPFDTIFGTAYAPLLHSRSIQRATDYVIPYARQVLDASAPHQNDRVLLEVVAFIRDVGDHLKAIGQPDLGHFPHG